jgi:hypothetical protein
VGGRGADLDIVAYESWPQISIRLTFVLSEAISSLQSFGGPDLTTTLAQIERLLQHVTARNQPVTLPVLVHQRHKTAQLVERWIARNPDQARVRV